MQIAVQQVFYIICHKILSYFNGAAMGSFQQPFLRHLVQISPDGHLGTVKRPAQCTDSYIIVLVQLF